MVSAACGAHANRSHSMQVPFSPQSSGCAATMLRIWDALGLGVPGLAGGNDRRIIRPSLLSTVCTVAFGAGAARPDDAGATHPPTTTSAPSAASARNRILIWLPPPYPDCARPGARQPT